ncbi:DUF3826 domain-containing protein [Arachidicoccus sp.]|jgi:hypothetical protein|uniref:DUF3826 domain-containing protein n=1 Tax=Arachidicoccus sp. TaxID=1872624 RepID=UPI003D254AB2
MRRVIYFFSGLVLSLFFLSVGSLSAQSNVYPGTDTAYTKMISSRSKKIVDKLDISDPALASRVQEMVAKQYFDLNVVYTARNKDLKALKSMSSLDKAAKAKEQMAIENRVDAAVQTLHYAFIAELKTYLLPKQVDGVKDGMTYSVLEVTYHSYMEMLPNLSTEQKNQMMTWLLEAREHAMDAGSSEKKHAWFGKYKGRINNYLAKSGIDMKQAEKDWMTRMKEGKNKKVQ